MRKVLSCLMLVCLCASLSLARQKEPAPTACKNCVPMQEERDGVLSRLQPQCEGIWRKPEMLSSPAATEFRNCSSGVSPSCSISARSR